MQTHGGLDSRTVAASMGRPELQAHVLKALESMVTGRLPLEYHALRLITSVLNLEYRRHAASKPNLLPPERAAGEPESTYAERLEREWWPTVLHEAYLVLADKHYHVHMFTCEKYTRGKWMCRLCASWFHGNEMPVVLELHKNSEESTCPDAPFEFRCSKCYAVSGFEQNPERLTKELQAAQAERLKERDLRHGLDKFTATRPQSPARSCEPPTQRAFFFASARPHLPERDDGSALAVLLRDPPCLQDNDDGARREHLRKVTAESEPLGRLLRAPPFAHVLSRLMDVLREPDLPPEGDDGTRLRKVKQHTLWLRIMFAALCDKKLQCANGVTAEASIVMSALLAGNINPLFMGAGAGAEGMAAYVADYTSKPDNDVHESITVYLIVRDHIDRFKTKWEHDPKDPLERSAIHFLESCVIT